MPASPNFTGTSAPGQLGFRPLRDTWGSGSGRTTTTYSSPSSGVQSGMQSLVEAYNQQFSTARSQNEARFQEMMGIASATTQQRAADIRTGAAGEKSDMMQQLARSGLGGSSVGSVLGEGIGKRKNEALDRLADTMQQTKLGILREQEPSFPDLATLQSTLTGVAGQYGQGQGIQSLLTALGGIQG